ncbi:MAG TPA: hypothetical protein VI542_01620, partial [Candidatus Tectomicrobia bacterium]
QDEAYRRTRHVIDRLLTLFHHYDIAVTWATIGHLFLDHCDPQDGIKHPEMPRPQHSWFNDDWYIYDPGSNLRESPLWYGRDMVEQILAAEPKHDVGSHSFSHVIFNDRGCTRDVAEAEIRKCVELAADLSLKMKSFVFPRNAPGHVDLLRKYGFCVTRGELPFWFVGYRSRTMRRLCHVLDNLLAITPTCGLPQASPLGLWVVPASMFLQSMDGPRRFIPIRSRIKKGMKGIEEAVREKAIFHLTFHPINMCVRSEQMFLALEGILVHAANRREQGLLQVMTMADIAELCESRSQ